MYFVYSTLFCVYNIDFLVAERVFQTSSNWKMTQEEVIECSIMLDGSIVYTHYIYVCKSNVNDGDMTQHLEREQERIVYLHTV